MSVSFFSAASRFCLTVSVADLGGVSSPLLAAVRYVRDCGAPADEAGAAFTIDLVVYWVSDAVASAWYLARTAGSGSQAAKSVTRNWSSLSFSVWAGIAGRDFAFFCEPAGTVYCKVTSPSSPPTSF